MNRILIVSITTWIGINLTAFAQGDLMIFPKRIVFEGNKQKEELNLSNIGKDTAIYSISFLQYNMEEDGSFKLIENATEGQWYADPYLRFFPRKVTLAPGESQSIRLQLRRKADMPAGEYRSHLYFRSEKANKPLGMETPKDKSAMSVQLIPVFGISIPTIIRIGQTQVTSSISDLKRETAKDSTSVLKLTVHRMGNCSIYGDISVEFLPTKGKPVEIGAIRGIGIYTNINKRYCTIPLNNPKDTNLRDGKIRVRFTSPKDTPYVLYAEKEL